MTGLRRPVGPAERQALPPVLVALVVGAILAAAALVSACGQPEPASSLSPSTPLETVRPSGDVARPFAFEWRGGSVSPGGVVYRVSVFDPAERLLHSWETRSRRVEPPRDLDQYFRNGGSFLWKVAELGRDGEPAAETPLTRFTLR